MPGMRHGGCDARIAPRGGNPFLSKRWVIVGMNEEMRHPRVLRVLLVKLLQDGRRFDLVGIGYIVIAQPLWQPTS